MQYGIGSSAEERTISPMEPRHRSFLLTAWTTAPRIEQLMRRELEAADADTPQFALLTAIHLLEPVTPKRLVTEMGMPPATISDRLRELFELGHIRREPNPEDGRSYVITTTAAGRRTLDHAEKAVWRAREAVERELDVPVPDVELAVEKLNRALDAALAGKRDRPRRHRYA
jgi:DNA-binding MarR family transcriptional regulator